MIDQTLDLALTKAEDSMVDGDFWYTDNFDGLWSCHLIEGRMYPTGKYGGKLGPMSVTPPSTP